MNKFIVITCLLINVLLLSTTTFALNYDINSPDVKEIASKFSMDGHADHDISTCETKQRYYLDIAALLNEGKTKEEVFEYYYSMYGEEGLRAPNKSGFSLLAWITPFIVIAIAGVALFKGIQTMSKNRQVVRESVYDLNRVEEEIVKSVINEERKKYF